MCSGTDKPYSTYENSNSNPGTFTRHDFSLFDENDRKNAAGDIDHDGDVDLLRSEYWYLNDGHQNFTRIETQEEAWQPLADVDGDGDLDILVFADRGLQVFKNRFFNCPAGKTGPQCQTCTYPAASGENCDICTEDWGGAYCNVCLVAGGCSP